jgi:hypothetical protein
MDEGINRFKNLSFTHTRLTDTPSIAAKRQTYVFEEEEKTTENRLSKSKDLR